MKFKENILDILKEKVAVHCKTKEEAVALLKELKSNGVKWIDDSDLDSAHCWNVEKENTCYTLEDMNSLLYCPIDYYVNMKYNIIDFEDLLEDERSADKEVFDKNTADKVYEEAYRIAGKALEKQIPKRPDYEGDGYDDNGNLIYDTWICRCCEERYEVDYDHYKYCPNCGQAIDWSDEDGEDS